MLTAAATDDDPARVINTGSVDGIVPPGRGRDNFSYSASKAAVHMLTQHLAGELAPRILVNAIAPGLFESRMTKELLQRGVGRRWCRTCRWAASASPTTSPASPSSSPAAPAPTSPAR